MLIEKRDYVLDEIIKYGWDVKNRIVYFGDISDNENRNDESFGDVNCSSIEYVIRKFNKFIADDPEHTVPIHFWMSSRGGDVYDMLRLCDRIVTCPCPVIFYGSGRIMSAATWIMVVCDERYLFQNSTVLVHHGSTALSGNYTDVQIDMHEEERLTGILSQIYADNTFIPSVEFWKDFLQRDVIMRAEEAIELGLADKMIEQPDRHIFRTGRLNLKPNEEKIELTIKDLYVRTKRNPEKIIVTPCAVVSSEIIEQINAENKVSKKKKGRPKKIVSIV